MLFASVTEVSAVWLPLFFHNDDNYFSLSMDKIDFLLMFERWDRWDARKNTEYLLIST